jgi:hypothetical protein
MEKFKFDLEFSDDGKARERRPAVKRSYRAEEVELVRTQARAEGERSAVAEAERQAARSLGELAKGIHEVLSMARIALDEVHDDATRLAATIGRKLATHAFDIAPESFFERTIGDCLDLLRREPAIRISIPTDSPASLRAQLESLAVAHGLSGQVLIAQSDAMERAECRLDWNSGGAEISLVDALTRMDAIIEERISALQATRPAAPQAARSAG